MKPRSSDFVVLAAVLLCCVIVSCSDRIDQSSLRNELVVLGRALQSPENMVPEGSFHIQVLQGDEWVPAGSLPFDKYYRTFSIDIKDVRPRNGQYRFRIIQSGGGAAHLDCVTLSGVPPEAVNGSGIEAEWALRKVSAADYDIIHATEHSVELVFPADKTAGREELALELTGRIENEIISKNPLILPYTNIGRLRTPETSFYSYSLGTVTDHPFIKEWAVSGSGHPPGYVYIYIEDDEDNLYVEIDFTGDNTLDGSDDYAKIYTPTAIGTREFRISAGEEEWGAASFVYTDKVEYQHKVYTFAIPLSDLAPGADREVQLAFSLYGTFATNGQKLDPDVVFGEAQSEYLLVYHESQVGQDINSVFLDLAGNLVAGGGPLLVRAEATESWDPMQTAAYDSINDRFLVVWHDLSDAKLRILGQRISSSNEKIGGIIDIGVSQESYQSSPAVAFDSESGTFFVVWADARTINDEIYGQLVNADGTLSGSNFKVTKEVGGFQNYPSVAFNPVEDNYLVVWTDGSDNSTIGGMLVSKSGTLLKTADLDLSSTGNVGGRTSLAYNPDLNNYLVVWDDSNDVYGRIVSATGIPAGTDEDISNEGSEGHGRPDVVYDADKGNYFVVWEDARLDPFFLDVYGQRVSSAGQRTGTVIQIAASGANAENDPTVAAHTYGGSVLVSYMYDDDPNNGDLLPDIVVDSSYSVPNIHFSAESYDFGKGNEGEASGAVSLSLANTGVGSLTVYSVELTGTGLNDYTIVTDIADGSTLATGQIETFDVSFSPQSGGVKDVIVTVTSSDSNDGEITLSVTGEARGIPHPVFPDDGLEKLSNEVTFVWKDPYVPEDETATIRLYLDEDESFGSTVPYEVAMEMKPIFLLAGFGLLGAIVMAGIPCDGKRNRKNRNFLSSLLGVMTIILALSTLFAIGACKPVEVPNVGGDESSYTVSGLERGSTYYWKVAAEYSSGEILESEVRSFTTQ